MNQSEMNIDSMICDLENEVALSGNGEITALAAVALIVVVIMN